MFNIGYFLKTNRRILLGLALILLIYWFFYQIWIILPPFIIGLFISYLLFPIHRLGMKYKIPRAISALILVVFVASIIILFLFLMIPWIISQFVLFINVISVQFYAVIQWLFKLAKHYHIQSIIPDFSHITGYFSQIAKLGIPFLQYLVSHLTSWLVTLGLLVITPLTTYYFLKDWDILLRSLRNLFHLSDHLLASNMLVQINKKLKRYLLGVAFDAFVLSMYYSFALWILGVPVFLFLGILSGLLNLLPYIGPFIGYLFALMIVYNIWHSWIYVIIISFVYLGGYIIDGYILQPYVLGKNIGISPGLVLFVVMAGGTLYGIIGVLLALPMAAILSVIMPYWLKYIIDGSVDI